MQIDSTCFSWVQLIKKSTDIPSNAKFVALYLSTWMNLEHDIAWPSIARISTETGLSKPTAIKWLKWLADNEWLEVDHRGKKVGSNGGEQTNNQYKISIPRWLNDLTTLTKGGKTVDTKVVKQFNPNNNINNNNIYRGNSNKPPSLEDVKEYFTTNGFSVEAAERAYWYYEECRRDNNDRVWKDSRGNTVKNWKQKMRGVWFKPENQIKSNGCDFGADGI